MVDKATAFSPGHITAFFQVHDDPDPLRKGSRGVGISLSRGVTTTVRLRQSTSQRMSTLINGTKAPAEVSEAAARHVLGGKPWEVSIDSTVELPISQGFGMSGAGALSTALATDAALGRGLSREEIIAAAHRSEVEAGTGLGDVYPQALGGIDIRVRPGAPPHGQVDRMEWEGDVLLCVVGAPLKTSEVLARPAFLERLGRVGGECVDAFAEDRRMENLFMLARRFDLETGLVDKRILRAMEECRPYGSAAMSMLGRSLFAVGDLVNLKRVLRSYGYLVPTTVDNRGARLVEATARPPPG